MCLCMNYFVINCLTDKCRETEPVSEMKKGCCYSQGNYKLLMEFLGKETGKQNPKVTF